MTLDELGDEDFFSMDRETNEHSIAVDFDIVKGDITKREVDAIVNAAHEDLSGGGGVDGAIHAAAGQGLLGECLNLYGCPEGEARITGGYNLPAKYVIHTVGPVWSTWDEEQKKARETLCKCYKNCLEVAEKQGLKSIAFPCISTGAYCFPKESAARIAVHTIYEWIHSKFLSQRIKTGCYLDMIEVVCFTDKDVKIYEEALKDEENGRVFPKCHHVPKAMVCSYFDLNGERCRFGHNCWMDRKKE